MTSLSLNDDSIGGFRNGEGAEAVDVVAPRWMAGPSMVGTSRKSCLAGQRQVRRFLLHVVSNGVLLALYMGVFQRPGAVQLGTGRLQGYLTSNVGGASGESEF